MGHWTYGNLVNILDYALMYEWYVWIERGSRM